MPQNPATLLKAHPGVREVAVRSLGGRSGQQKLVAYVVPDEDYISRAFAGPEEERKRVQKWGKSFDLTQLVKRSDPSEPGFNIAGWNSSYTRQPLPAEHMREWVDRTVQELRAFHPREILEMGCGSGLLLLRLARECVRYVGADVAFAVLKKLREQMGQIQEDWSKVTLYERAADDFSGFAERSFDTVILNSVSQHFPSASYLTTVLERALRVVKPGGRIFIGDVRNLALLEPYAVSVELFQAEPAMPLAELLGRVHRRIHFEEQLVISPAFFLAFQARFPQVTGVEIHPKLGHLDNEMTRFRFNAILHLETPRAETLNLPFLDWAEHCLTLDSIAALLQDGQPESFAMNNIANARIEKDVAAVAILAVADPSGKVGEFREALAKRALQGIHPQSLWSLGEKLGYHVDISWIASRPDGSYDAVFRRVREGGSPPRTAIAWPHAQFEAARPAQFTNIPGRAILREKLMLQLLDYCRQNLPEEMVPAAVLPLDEIPLTSDGQLDVNRLPDADIPLA